MIELTAGEQARLERAAASYRNTAELLGELRDQLVEHGFSEAGAEAICDTYLGATLWHEST